LDDDDEYQEEERFPSPDKYEMHNSSVEKIPQDSGDLTNINLAGGNLRQYFNNKEGEHEDEPEIQDAE